MFNLSSWTPRRILITIGIGGFGLYLAWLGGADWYGGVRSTTWPTVTGSVLESQVERVPGHGRVAPSYKAHFQYRYEVAGRAYFGDHASLGRLSLGNGEDDADAIVRQYPQGSFVQVRYDPARPEVSVLQAGWTWSAVLRAVLGILVVLVVLAMGARGRSLTSA